MDLNLAFDDEDFNTSKKITNGDCDLPYNVKICTPEWFGQGFQYSVGKTLDVDQHTEEAYKTLKYQADLSYHKGLFAKAADQYEAVLEVLPLNNVTVCQDVRESLCRCYANYGDTEKSLTIARELVSDLASEDEAKQCQSLALLSTVCEKAGRWAECVETLEQYCCLYPYFAQSWGRLGNALMETDIATDVSHDSQLTRIKALTCYIRARFLCQISLGTASNLVKERDKLFISQMSEKIDLLPLPDEQKEFARSFMRGVSDADIQETSKSCQMTADCEEVKPSISKTFYRRFCSWQEAYQKQVIT